MKYGINLIGERKRDLLETVLYFFLNYLRYILVITQLVVIGVLFYRFSIDQSIIDLKETVDQKKEIVKTVSPLVAEVKKVDSQVTEIKKIVLQQDSQQRLLNYILSQFPASANLSQLLLDPDKISLIGSSNNPKDIQLFYNKLKKDGKFASVNFSNLQKAELGYLFTLELGGFKN